MLSQGQIIALIFVFLALIGGGIGIWYYTKNKSDLDNEKSTETNTPESNPTETNNPESNPTESNTDNLNGKYLFVKGQTVQFNEAQNFCELPNKMIEDSQAPLLNKNFTDDEDRTNNWGNPIWTNSGNKTIYRYFIH